VSRRLNLVPSPTRPQSLLWMYHNSPLILVGYMAILKQYILSILVLSCPGGKLHRFCDFCFHASIRESVPQKTKDKGGDPGHYRGGTPK